MSERRALRLPGRVFEWFAARAVERMEQVEAGADPAYVDIDLCNAISHARVKRRGGGYSVLIPMEPDAVLRLADWVGNDAPKQIRKYRDAMREQIGQLPGSGIGIEREGRHAS